MATSDSTARYRHASLPTQQRRLRHLRSIAVRNVTHTGKPGNNRDITETETYFTLHMHDKSEAFYTSERIRGSLNPTWRSFNLEHLTSESSSLVNTASTACIVRIWSGRGSSSHLSIEWTVSLDGLVYHGEKAQRENVKYPPNTLLFGILEGVYGVPSGVVASASKPCAVEVEQSSVRESYSTQTLTRIKTVLRAIKQTKSSVQRVKSSIEDKLCHSHTQEKKKSIREKQFFRISTTADDLVWRRRALRSERETYDNLKTENYKLEKLLVGEFSDLQKKRSDLHEKKKSYFDVREDLIKTGAQLVMRRKQLISELAFIYPIVQVSDADFTICGVRLPNSEDFMGQDETMIAVGLGYTCHLVSMISHFLEVPLRYPMVQQGSRSLIHDHIIDKLNDRERDFPLYSKGKEKFQFNYGVYLLNKNIAQLRYYCALGTTDLRLTLPNLKSLLEFRLGVKFETTNAPVLAGQHMAIPPNLGGPQKTTSPSFAQPPPPTNSTEDVTSPSSSQTDSSSIQETHITESQTYIEQADQRSDTNNSPMDQNPDAQADDGSSGVDVHISPCAVATENGVLSPDLLQNDHSSHSKIKTEAPQQNGPISRKDALEIKPVRSMVDFMDSSSFSPTNKTLDILTKEKLMGSIANYDDLDVSSSEDSACATYTSRFKMWPRDQPEFLPVDPQWLKEDNKKDVSSSEESDTKTLPTPTFKKKAMVSPTQSTGETLGKAGSQLAQSTQNDNTVEPRRDVESCKNQIIDNVSGPYHRHRTDSDADTDDSATFVVPRSNQLAVTSQNS